jgi:hypothetical protein
VAIHDREDSEEIFDLADVAQALGCLQVALHVFTVGCRDGNTSSLEYLCTLLQGTSRSAGGSYKLHSYLPDLV